MFDQGFDVIATREFSLTDSAGMRSIVLEIGSPMPYEGGSSFACPWRVRGLNDGEVRAAGGVDAIQAFLLALVNAASYLYTSEASQANQLIWDGDENGILGLPFVDIVADLVPTRSDGSKPKPLAI